MRLLTAAALVLTLMGVANAQGVFGEWSAVTTYVYDASEYETDDHTARLQLRMNAISEVGGGILALPRGRYHIKGNLTIPLGVTLEGVFTSVPSHPGLRDRGQPKPEYGTVLLAYAGRGTEDDAPFITISGNATLKGVVVYYPEQSNEGVPTPYPYAIAMRGNNPALIDVEPLNPYNGVDCTRNQRHLIGNVQGQPLRRGIFVDSIYDIGRIENVHWNPWFSMEKTLFEWQMENGEAFIFGRTDWQYVTNTFCFGYNIGYKFIQTENGVCNGNFLGIGADDCYTALQVDQCAPMGLLITNGEFVSFHGPDPTMVAVSETNTGSVRFVNCAYWGPNNQIAKIAGRGTVGFSDCTFMQWDRGKEGRHAIQATGGSLIVRGNEFRTNAPQVELGENVQRAVVIGNVITGAERITNRGAKSAQIGLNAATE
ncbi:MAG: hypothetical protein O3A46_01265 [Candidatus Poribacteria bacterium]|nr:hypothetical protein [Candidatus Poribacteria bacterium]